MLKKINNFSLDNQGFPKSRNIRQLNFYLKCFVLIREWLKESQNDIPEFVDETIYYLGQGYSLTCQNIKKNIQNFEDKNLRKKLASSKKVRQQILNLKHDIAKPDFGRE